MHIQGKKISVLGMARSGLAAALKARELGASVFISEKKTASETLQSVKDSVGEYDLSRLVAQSEFGGHTEKVLDCDYLIVSPGIPLKTEIIRLAYDRGIQVLSEIEFGFLIKSCDSKIIAITGSNGKSTTTSLIHHILDFAGYKAILAGNIGHAFTSFPIEKPGIDYIVLELSSFQLELIDSFRANTSVLLNITPDHLDRYHSLTEYIKAKLRIFENQSVGDRAILNGDDQAVMENCRDIIPQKHLFGKGANSSHNPSISNNACTQENFIYISNRPCSIDTSKTKLHGLHNKYNIMAALLAVEDLKLDIDVLEKGVQTFEPLAHRLEMVREIKGIKFFNDSKATNTESVKYALSAFTERVHLIAGGYDKGEDYRVLLPFLTKHVCKIYLIGETKNSMKIAFEPLGKRITEHSSLEEAIEVAYKNAEPNEVILLSPACASYDMFKNYEHRGNEFIRIVKGLKRI